MAVYEKDYDMPEPCRLRLHIHPGTSGLAPHMALLAAGTSFEVRTIDLFAGEARTPVLRRLNPFGTVPVLEDDETVIPETGAFLLHVAERFPDAELLPRGGADMAQALRWLFHAAALHADFMTWRRASMALREDRHAMEATQAWMAKRLAEAFGAIGPVLEGPFLVGATAGPADFYIFMVAGWWRKRFDFTAETPRLAVYLDSMAENPHVRAGSVRLGASKYRPWSRKHCERRLCGLQDAQHGHAPTHELHAALQGGYVLVTAGARAKVVTELVVASTEPGR